jgi:hypothetical protein
MEFLSRLSSWLRAGRSDGSTNTGGSPKGEEHFKGAEQGAVLTGIRISQSASVWPGQSGAAATPTVAAISVPTGPRAIAERISELSLRGDQPTGMLVRMYLGEPDAVLVVRELAKLGKPSALRLLEEVQGHYTFSKAVRRAAARALDEARNEGRNAR